eukprot:2352-Heterococcus_DN1.PRE.1
MLPNTRITFAYVIVLLGTAVACTAPRCCWCSSNTIALTVTLTLVLLLSLYTHSLQQVVRGQLDATGAYCTEPDEYKIIIGQGDPVVTSRFKDPTVASNSAWRPSSVPAVRAQPWQNNYKDGTCGLRNVTDNTQLHMTTSGYAIIAASSANVASSTAMTKH